MGPSEGDFVTILAITDPTKGYKGMSTIIIDRNTPGFIIGKHEEKMGIRAADVSELIFEDCRVPKTDLLGKKGNGFKIFMEALDGGGVGMASQALGIAEEALTLRSSGCGYMRDYPLERMYRDARYYPHLRGYFRDPEEHYCTRGNVQIILRASAKSESTTENLWCSLCHIL